MTLTGTIKKFASVILFIFLLSLIPLFLGIMGNFYNHYIDQRAQVGVLPIKDVLYDSGYYTKQLHKFFKDERIKAILLKIECPGSASGTGQIIFNEIMTLKKEYPKPVIALVENVCASGGYYIACASDHIIASPMSLIGSIGVAMPYFFQLKEFVEQFKIKSEPLAAGEYKNTGNPFSQLTPAQKEMLQGVLDDEYEQFVLDVATQRKLAIADAPIYGNGKIFSGRQALKLGLIDALGSTSQTIAIIKDKANIFGDIKWMHAPSKTSLWYAFSGDNDENQSVFSSCLHELCTVIESRYAHMNIH